MSDRGFAAFILAVALFVTGSTWAVIDSWSFFCVAAMIAAYALTAWACWVLGGDEDAVDKPRPAVSSTQTPTKRCPVLRFFSVVLLCSLSYIGGVHNEEVKNFAVKAYSWCRAGCPAHNSWCPCGSSCDGKCATGNCTCGLHCSCNNCPSKPPAVGQRDPNCGCKGCDGKCGEGKGKCPCDPLTCMDQKGCKCECPGK